MVLPFRKHLDFGPKNGEERKRYEFKVGTRKCAGLRHGPLARLAT